MAVTGNDYHAYLGKKQGMVDKALDKIKQEDIIARIWKHDYTIWKPEPTEISNRLGWLNSPDYMKERISEISRFVEEINHRNSGVRLFVPAHSNERSLVESFFKALRELKEIAEAGNVEAFEAAFERFWESELFVDFPYLGGE
ncbi:MAG: hypothetical protein ACK2TU_04530 [Anaerolineales bacterium]